jgi:hypothetical protein
MHRQSDTAAVSLLVMLACAAWTGAAAAQAPPTRYDAVHDRAPRPEPALPAPGIGGSSFLDPAFGTVTRRLTDRLTRPGIPDRSYRTPSGTHQNAWSASGRHFFVVSTDGTIVPFAFDPSNGRASRLPGRAEEGGSVLRFYSEPHFSYTRDGVVYGAASGGSLRTIDQFDFSTDTYTRLLDLESLVPGLGSTYVGGIGSSAGPVERVFAFFGGASQDRHRYLVVFDAARPSARRLLDTRASRLDGRPTDRLDFFLHAAAIDRSGRFVTLYPAAADRGAPRNAAPNYVWDLETDRFVELPGIAARSNGHDAYGYGVRVNQDCCTSTEWDAAQWQLRALHAPLATEDVIAPVMAPRQVYLADHPTWHNARPDVAIPFISALYRYGENTVPWRAWDDEIIAVQVGTRPAEVWRLAHHRSDVRQDADPSRISFWYTPRPNVSPDGRWVLFTSNWEKSLGTDPAGDAGTRARQDVFLLRLEGTAGPAPPAPPDGGEVAITTTTLPDARLRRVYSAQLNATGVPEGATWRIAGGGLPSGLRLHPQTGAIGGAAREAGTFTFSVSVGGATQTFNLRVR